MTAPPAIVPGDLVATEHELYRVEVVLPVRSSARCVPVLGWRLELRVG